MKQTTTDRTEAAFKAAETRRRNKRESTKRALKAWETRRQVSSWNQRVAGIQRVANTTGLLVLASLLA